MAISTYFTFKFKRGTAAEWVNANPILDVGEPGVETDTNKVKIGNGVAHWSTLPYLVSDSGGTAGPPGPPGASGSTGATGSPGAAGQSAYAAAVAAGYVGTQAQWLASMNPALLSNSPATAVIAIVKVGSVWPARGTSRADIRAFFIGAGSDPADMLENDVRIII